MCKQREMGDYIRFKVVDYNQDCSVCRYTGENLEGVIMGFDEERDGYQVRVRLNELFYLVKEENILTAYQNVTGD